MRPLTAFLALAACTEGSVPPGGAGFTSTSPATATPPATATQPVKLFKAPDPNIFQFQSRAFASGTLLPEMYTTKGSGLSPPIEWCCMPPEARALAVLVEDAGSHFTHLLVYDLPPRMRVLPEGFVRATDVPPSPVRIGLNSHGDLGWAPPTPSAGRQKLVFRLFALAEPTQLGRASRADFDASIVDKVVEEVSFTAMY